MLPPSPPEPPLPPEPPPVGLRVEPRREAPLLRAVVERERVAVPLRLAAARFGVEDVL